MRKKGQTAILAAAGTRMVSSFLQHGVNSSQGSPIPANMYKSRWAEGFRSLTHYRRWPQITKLHDRQACWGCTGWSSEVRIHVHTLCSKTAPRTLLILQGRLIFVPFEELGKFLKRLGQESQTTELLEALRDHRLLKLPCCLLRPLHAHYKSSVVAHRRPGLLGPFPTQALQRSTSYS